MAISGIDTMMNYYSMASGGVSSLSSQTYDYKSLQKQTQSLIDTYKKSNTSVKSLTSDSADFLKTYTSSMNTLNSSAAKLTNGGINKTLYNDEGQVTDATVKDTMSLMKDMVADYNSTLKMLGGNEDRGRGVTKQIARMTDSPAARQGMEMVGVSMNKDGTLALDEAKLTSALKSENPLQVRLAADIIGGSNGIAAGVQRDARAGLNTSANSLIGNDIAKMQSARDNDPIRTFAQSLRGGGAYALNNSAAMGIMMNMLV